MFTAAEDDAFVGARNSVGVQDLFAGALEGGGDRNRERRDQRRLLVSQQVKK